MDARTDAAAAVLDKRVRQLAERHGLTIVELAAKAEMARTHLHEILGGKRDPRLSTIVKLAAALDVEPWQLLKPPR